MPHQTKSQILIATIIVLMATLGIGAVVLSFSRSVRETTHQQLDVNKASSLAKSGLKVGIRCAKNDPLGCSLYNQTSTVELGGGNYTLNLIQTTYDAGGGKTFVNVAIASKGQYGRSTRILTDSFQTTVTAAVTEAWVKVYGWSTGSDHSDRVELTSDGGYISYGDSRGGGSNEDSMLMKVDSKGDLVWAKIYHGNVSDHGHYAKVTSDGGYILGGESDSFGTVGNDDLLLIKTDDQGNVIGGKCGTSQTCWAKAYFYGGTASDELLQVINQTSDGGYIFGGSSTFSGNNDFIVIKTNQYGNLTWAKRYGGNGDDFLRNIMHEIIGPPVKYLIGGFTNSFTGNNDGFLIRIYANGTLDTTFGGNGARTYGTTGTGDERFGSYEVTPTGYVFGHQTTYSGCAGNQDMFVVATDFNGNLTGGTCTSSTCWAKCYGDNLHNYADALKRTPDGGFVFGGMFKDTFLGISRNGLVIKTDDQGNFLGGNCGNGQTCWKKKYGPSGANDVHSLQLASDGGYILGGSTTQVVAEDVWLLKVDSLGDVANCSQITNATIQMANITGNVVLGTPSLTTNLDITAVVNTTTVTSILNVTAASPPVTTKCQQ